MAGWERQLGPDFELEWVEGTCPRASLGGHGVWPSQEHRKGAEWQARAKIRLVDKDEDEAVEDVRGLGGGRRGAAQADDVSAMVDVVGKKLINKRTQACRRDARQADFKPLVREDVKVRGRWDRWRGGCGTGGAGICWRGFVSYGRGLADVNGMQPRMQRGFASRAGIGEGLRSAWYAECCRISCAVRERMGGFWRVWTHQDGGIEKMGLLNFLGENDIGKAKRTVFGGGGWNRMQGSRGWAGKSDFFVFRTGGTDPGGTDRALRSGPVGGCKIFAQANSAATDGGSIETSCYREVGVMGVKMTQRIQSRNFFKNNLGSFARCFVHEGRTYHATATSGAGMYRTAMYEEDSEQENTSHDAQQSEEGVSRNHTECYLANNARVIDSMGAVDHAPNFGVHSTRTYIAMAHLNTWISRARGGKGSREEMINGTMRIRRSESDAQLEQCVQGDTDEADVHDARVQCFKLTRDTTSECGGAVGKREAVWGLT
ncbi:hypothetical protein C8J57DRAFT_1238039 [Mycena rebaudengoi]|nr:hypothetical protein C8J57DRAFT_1238039 [Mycena rebaudengoi]